MGPQRIPGRQQRLGVGHVEDRALQPARVERVEHVFRHQMRPAADVHQAPPREAGPRRACGRGCPGWPAPSVAAVRRRSPPALAHQDARLRLVAAAEQHHGVERVGTDAFLRLHREQGAERKQSRPPRAASSGRRGSSLRRPASTGARSRAGRPCGTSVHCAGCGRPASCRSCVHFREPGTPGARIRGRAARGAGRRCP